MRSKVLIAVLIAFAMLFSFGIAVKDAKADALLFPWVTKSTSVSTLISVVNTAGMVGTYEYASVPFRLHYQYWYKNSTANLQTEGCTNHSFKQKTSKDDIVSFDASGNINGGFALFNDPSPYTAGQSFKLDQPAPRRSFLIVDNNTPAFTGSLGDVTNVDGTLYGEAIVLELSGGAAWGYIAYNGTGGPASTQTSAVTFSDGQDLLGEVIGGKVERGSTPAAFGEVTQTVLLPSTMGTTRFFMTPVDRQVSNLGSTGYSSNPDCSDGPANQRDGNINARIQFIVQDTNGDYIGGIFDNDESVLDFNKKKDIVCTSADNASALIQGGALTYLETTGRQGWGMIGVLDGKIDGADGDICPDNTTTDMIIGKLEFTTTGITIDGTTMSGTFNNFLWLRDSTSVTSCQGTNCIHNELFVP